MIVHIVDREGRPLCGFVTDPPERWPEGHKAVLPEEAHFATCQRCVEQLHNDDELNV